MNERFNNVTIMKRFIITISGLELKAFPWDNKTARLRVTALPLA